MDGVFALVSNNCSQDLLVRCFSLKPTSLDLPCAHIAVNVCDQSSMTEIMMMMKIVLGDSI